MSIRIDPVAVRRPRIAGKSSGALVAAWSFLFPGLGHAYLGNRRSALLFALPALAVVAIVSYQLRAGMSRAALTLLDPTMAMAAFAVVVLLGFWRVTALLHAWRASHRTRLSRSLVAALIATIALSHAYVGASALQLRDAGNRIFSTDPFAEMARPGGATGLPNPAGPKQSPLPGSTTTPTPVAGYQADPHDAIADPDDAVNDPEPAIEPGPSPEVDIVHVDGLDDGLLNVLVVGIDWMAGRDHALTDTMIVVSVNAETTEVLMFSFPRDIARFPLYDGGTYTGRLNTFANYAGHHPGRYPDGAMRALTLEIGFLLGIPIDYYASVNIPGFAAVIKAVGGVTIDNQIAINDTHLNFSLPAGRQRLNAQQALMWVRSRHGPGNNDFARAARQQQMLAALRRELLRPERIAEVPQIMAAVSEVLSTDFPPNAIDQLLRLAEMVEDEERRSWVFGFPDWSLHPPRSETGGRSIMMLRVDKVEQLSRELFGDKSLYGR
jgi:LCP family protein required for cell wall assembly